MAFTQKLIAASVALAANTQTNQPITFAESGTDTVNLSGSRTSLRIVNSGAPVDCRATLRIYGMTQSLMNQLSTLGLVFNIVPRNTITISAGDATSGMSIVFSGTIYAAYGDYSAQPDVPFIFECNSVVADAVIPAAVSTFTGPTDVATIMAGLARAMGMGFENNGVSVQIANPYLSGSYMIQAKKIAEHANISWGVLPNNVLSIWPKGGSRNTPNVPKISVGTGMVSYPGFTAQGIIVKTLFNPLLSFGSLVEVDSSLLSGISQVKSQQAQASGQSQSGGANFPSQWTINKLDLALDSLFPKGDWLSTIYAYNPGYAKGIQAPGV
jgi:hypothetical protein